jgi:PAS domain S-box-containing protein
VIDGNGDDLDLLLATRAKLLEADAELRALVDELAGKLERNVVEGRRYRDFFEANDQPRIIADRGGTIREANPAGCDFFGVQRLFLVGKPMAVFVDPDDVRAFRNAVATAGRATVQITVRMRGRGTPAQRVELSGTPLRDGSRSLWFLTVEPSA